MPSGKPIRKHERCVVYSCGTLSADSVTEDRQQNERVNISETHNALARPLRHESKVWDCASHSEERMSASDKPGAGAVARPTSEPADLRLSSALRRRTFLAPSF